MTTEHKLWLFVFFLFFIILYQWVRIKFLKDRIFTIAYKTVKNVNETSQLQLIRVGAMAEILRIKRKFNAFRNAWYHYQQAQEGWTVGEMSLWVTQQDIDLTVEPLDDFSAVDTFKPNKNE